MLQTVTMDGLQTGALFAFSCKDMDVWTWYRHLHASSQANALLRTYILAGSLTNLALWVSEVRSHCKAKIGHYKQ